MTHDEMVRFLAERTGYPQRVVAHILSEQVDMMKTAFRNGSSVRFRGLMVLEPYARNHVANGVGGVQGVRRQVRLRITPVRTFRKEMNQWTSTASPSTQK